MWYAIIQNINIHSKNKFEYWALYNVYRVTTYLILSNGVSPHKCGSQNPADPSPVVSGENLSEINVTRSVRCGIIISVSLTAVESPITPAPMTLTFMTLVIIVWWYSIFSARPILSQFWIYKLWIDWSLITDAIQKIYC